VPGRARCHGALLALTREPRAFSDADVRFVQQVANVLGAALDNRQAAEELRRSESDLKVLIEHTPDNIVRFDRDLRFSYVNPALERMMGLPASQIVGQTLGKIGEFDEQTATWERKLRRVFRSGEEDELEARYGDRWFQVLLCPEFGPDGEVSAVLGVGRDITSNKQREAERSQLYQALLERDTRLHDLLERVLLNQQSTARRPKLEGFADQFTARERQILRLLARGLTNRQISAEVNLRPSTVKNHIAALLPRLNAQDRTQAAVAAAQLGLLDGSD
jgi:PAS domain S-box-containing protein